MPSDVPPVDVVYQLMLLPVEVAFRLDVAFTHSVDGVAVTDPGADGADVTPTVVVTVLEHPVPGLVYEYVINEAPDVMPVTSPEVKSMVATEGDPLVQVPPVVVLLSVVVRPMHTAGVPVIAGNAGSAFTVSVFCALVVPPQPPEIVYTMLHEPAVTAVTAPVVELTVAMAVLLLLHAPVPLLKTTVFAAYVAVVPTHNGVVPVTEPMLAFG